MLKEVEYCKTGSHNTKAIYWNLQSTIVPAGGG